MDKKARVIFIIPDAFTDKSQCSEVMHRAYEASKTNLMSVEWLDDPEDFDELSAEKMDFLVFEKFEGVTFNRFKSSRCVIVGPSCLLTCLVEGRSIPNFPWPIFNVAMSDCSVTVSHLPKHVKEKIKEKVQIMAGYYTDSVYNTTTHLITDTVKTDKYLRASEVGVKVMVPAWIDEVWKASLAGNIHCNDAQFDKYRCPTFYNMTIAITGFKSLEDRHKIARLVEENGGVFKSQLHVSTTDILICEESANSEKFKVAKKSRSVKCVTYNWLIDSIEKGYALPDEPYSMKNKPSASTPTKFDNFVDPNFSMMSAISSNTTIGQQSLCQDTILPPPDVTLSEVTPRKRKSSSLDDVDDMLEAIDLRVVKKAGSFLDGCCVFVAGFTPEQREPLYRVLSLGDATRYDHISERITHIIIGDPTSSEVKAMQGRGYPAPVVSLAWVIECIRQKRVVDEERYLFNLHRNDATGASSSPLSQKGLKLLRREISVIEPAPELTPVGNEDTLVQEDAVDIDTEIMQQYKKIATTATEDDTLAVLLRGENFDSKCAEIQKPDDTEISNHAVCNANQTPSQAASYTLTETEDDTTDGFFQNIKFKVFGYADDNLSNIHQFIESNSGQILPENHPALPDFVVVPTFYDGDLEDFTAWRVVTGHFLMACVNEGAMVGVKYFHQPLKTDDSTPLEGCVITLSVYTGSERSYLNEVVEKLGGICQDQLCRMPKPDIFASTHLLCPEAQGRKYDAALKWGLPVIDKDWLLACARVGRYADEEPFLIGNSKASERSKAAKLREASTLLMNNKGNTFDSLPNVTPVGSNKDKVEVALENLAPSTSRTGTIPKTPNSNLPIELKPALANSNTSKQKEASTSLTDGKQRTSDSLPNITPTIDSDENNDNEVFVENVAPNTSTTETALKTPKNYFPSGNKPGYTPLRHDSSLTASSQVTPVNKIMERFQMNAMLEIPTVTPPLTRRYNDVDTPETPYGAFITPNPSPHLRKEMLKWLNRIPEHKPRRDSTPFSEIKRQLWNKICPPSPKTNDNAFPQPNFDDCENATTDTIEAPVVNSASNSIVAHQLRFSTASEGDSELMKDGTSTNPEVPETPQRSKIDSNLQQLQEMLASSGGTARRSVKKRESILPVHEAPQLLSQVYSVGWDYSEAERAVERLEPVEAIKKRAFMITSFDKTQRDSIIREIQELGGEVSELNQYDPEGTHLITPKPQRTEKILCSMAAGKWILHPSYLSKSVEAGKFLKEEEFEYGNPNARKDIAVEFERDMKVGPEALHYWRVEVNKRGYGAFHDMRAIVVASRRESIVRVIEAGGGMVINESPPFKDTVFATHCLVDEKTTKDQLSLFVPLAKNGVYCVNILYISDYLYRNARDIRDFILPYFTKYYKE